MSYVDVELEDQTVSVKVDDVDNIERWKLATKAPGELIEMAEMQENGEEIPEDIYNSGEMMEYFIYVLTSTTEFTEKELNRMQLERLIKTGAAVLEHVFDEGEPGGSNDKGLKRVSATREFINALFSGDMGIVAGLPDDVRLHDFEYDPSRQTFVFIFESDEWEPVPEGAEIPETEPVGISIPYGEKEL